MRATCWPSIQARGELIVATEGTWAPFTYHDENDELVGYDVEVARLVAEQLGVTATFVEGEFDGLLAGVEGGRYDHGGQRRQRHAGARRGVQLQRPLPVRQHGGDRPGRL